MNKQLKAEESFEELLSPASPEELKKYEKD